MDEDEWEDGLTPDQIKAIKSVVADLVRMHDNDEDAVKWSRGLFWSLRALVLAK